MVVSLTCLAATFAGLTLGIMGLDTLNLEIIADGGQEPDRSYAKKILPIRKLGNQLLCTLLLGNVITNAVMAELFGSFVSGQLGSLAATAVITLGAEIIPQATCAKFALRIGSASFPLVKFFLILFYPVSKPFGMLLDRVLGDDPGQIYDRNELTRLIMIQSQHKQHGSNGQGLTEIGSRYLVQALNFAHKKVEKIMTPSWKMFFLDENAELDGETLLKIAEEGHSRIPVLDQRLGNCIGVLHAKDLILVPPSHKIRVRDFLRWGPRNYGCCDHESPLSELLKDFSSGRSHISMVRQVESDGMGDPIYRNVGLVTFEDVIEELTGQEILDEHDVRDANDEEVPQFRRRPLTEGQVIAVTTFLKAQLEEFRELPDEVLMTLVAQSGFKEYNPPPACRSLPLNAKENCWVYTCGAESTVFTLVLRGSVQVLIGTEDPSATMGAWKFLGQRCLRGKYVPDFFARVVEPSRLVQIRASSYRQALAETQHGRKRHVSMMRSYKSEIVLPNNSFESRTTSMPPM